MSASIVNGNALALPLADNSVQCAITSPPYWSLRDYGVAGQLGLEPVPDCLGWATGAPCGECYVCHMVQVFREVRRVLRDDGTCWLNLGDSFASGEVGRHDSVQGREIDGKRVTQKATKRQQIKLDTGLKPKDLIGIPWRVAFALQADGWWLRSDIIWAKPNPMPESVTDRPTKAHEYLFLLAKSARYYYDAEAVKEGKAESTVNDKRDNGNGRRRDRSYPGAPSNGGTNLGGSEGGRNRRTVWTIATQAYSGAHFATFPEKLVEPCLLAGSSERGACPHCGAPWARVVERDRSYDHVTTQAGKSKIGPYATQTGNGEGTHDIRHGVYSEVTTTGWSPTCACNLDGIAFEPDDLEIIETPTGERAGADPTMQTGRKGLNRPRGDNEGQRPITRYEQRRYAEQLRNSPHRAEMATAAGQAFDHYTRTDKSGARPVPAALLADWIDRGWLERVEPPVFRPYEPRPCVVLDPFSGSGTVGRVAVKHRRRFVGVELNPKYIALAEQRTGRVQVEMAL